MCRQGEGGGDQTEDQPTVGQRKGVFELVVRRGVLGGDQRAMDEPCHPVQDGDGGYRQQYDRDPAAGRFADRWGGFHPARVGVADEPTPETPTYCVWMLKTLVKWSIRLTLVAGVATAVARVLGSRSDGAGRTEGSIPTIGGDTWPPVPVNPDRKD